MSDLLTQFTYTKVHTTTIYLVLSLVYKTFDSLIFVNDTYLIYMDPTKYIPNHIVVDILKYVVGYCKEALHVVGKNLNQVKFLWCLLSYKWVDSLIELELSY